MDFRQQNILNPEVTHNEDNVNRLSWLLTQSVNVTQPTRYTAPNIVLAG